MRKIVAAALVGATLMASSGAQAQTYYAREYLHIKSDGTAADANPNADLATSVLINSANGDCIQIAEVEAYSGGTNVALASAGATASSSSPYSGEANASKTNDGVKPAGYPNIFHSSCGSGDFLRITFKNPVKIDSVKIYGRADGYANRDVYTYSILAGTTVIGGGTIDATSGSGSTVPVVFQPSPPAPPMPDQNSTPDVAYAYLSWLGTDWKRMAAERGVSVATSITQSRLPPSGNHINGAHYEYAGWYSRYGFSNPEPYIYFSLNADDWEYTAFCTNWARVKPQNASNCDSYYGNHITFYLN